MFHIRPIARDDVAEIIFTSGATAEPKGVIITHRNVLANIVPVEHEILKYRKWGTPFFPLRFLNLLPLSHMFGQAMATYIPPMIRGQVVFINSGAGLNVSPGLAAYSASKFALRAFADSLRADEPSLRVTSVHPGRVDTEMQRDLVGYEGGEYDPANFLSAETVARIVAEVIATPEDAHTHQIVVRPR